MNDQSTQAAAAAWLMQAFATAAAGVRAGVEVARGAAKSTANDQVVVANTIQAQDTSVAGIGPIVIPLAETYQVSVEVSHFEGGDDFDGCDTRGRALLDAVWAAVRADMSLGGAVTQAWPTTPDVVLDWADQILENAPAAAGPFFAAAFFVNCTAYVE